MAGEAARTIEVVDMSAVWGGNDQDTSEMMSAIAHAIDVAGDVSRKVAPRHTSVTELLLQVLAQRRSRSGPSSAPALPPTSTLTR